MVNDNRRSWDADRIAAETDPDPVTIVDLKVHMLGSDGIRRGILRIITEEGIEGWCYSVTEDTARTLTSTFRDKLVGRNAMARERIWHDLLMWERFGWPPKELRGSVDIALWDIAGKKLGQPIWRLLGACRDRVPAYRTQGGTLGPEGSRIDHFVDFALKVQAEGYRGSKDHCYAGPQFMIELAGELRDAVGPDFHLMHDAVQHYDVKEAVRVGRALEKHRFSWFEEPVRDHDLAGLRQVREALPEIDVVAGEYFPHQIHGYAQMLAQGAVDGFKSPIESGGITEVVKLAHLAEGFGARVHVQASDITWGFAPVHANGAVENTSLLEVHPPFEGHRTPAVRNPLVVEDGYVRMPEGPGLGIELDWEIIERETTEVIA